MFYPLEKLHLLHDGYRRAFRIGRVDLLLVQKDGRTFLIENSCPHMQAPLTHGAIQNGIIRCPMHGLEFNLLTGRSPTCATPLKTFMPAYEGNLLGVVL